MADTPAPSVHSVPSEGPRSKRRVILDAAIDHFGELGFKQTKWATIADQVGIGQTALYHYFESKVHCILTIMRRAGAVGAADSHRGHGTGRSPADAASGRCGVLRDHSARGTASRILLSHQDLLIAERKSQREETERKAARELVRTVEKEWASMLRAGIDAGAFPEHDEKSLARVVLGLINSVWRWYRPGGPQRLPQISKDVVEACVRLVH